MDASGKIYVLNSAEYPEGSFNYLSWFVNVYPPLETGTGIINEAPIAAIGGSNTLLDNPGGIAVDSQGDLYVANESGGPDVPNTEDQGMVTIYPAGSNGNVAPIATISGAATGLAYPVGIALDSGGNIYVANYYTANTSSNLEYDSSVTVYPAGSNGNASPITIIAGNNVGLAYVKGIALDSSRNLYVAGYAGDGLSSVKVYSAGSNGNVSPAATIAGTDTGLQVPNGIALDSGGNLYVSNGYGGPTDDGSVTIYPAGSCGDAVPAATITSNDTGIHHASGIAMDSSGNIYVTNEFDIAIYAAGSYATGPPITTIAGDNTGLYGPSGIALDSRGNIFALNLLNAITVYPAGSAGDVMPKATIKIRSGERNSPTGIAVGPHRQLYVVSPGGVKCYRRSCQQVSPGNVAIYPAGSNGNDKPSAVIAGPHTRLATPAAVAVDHKGYIYVANEGRPICTGSCGCYPTGNGSVTVYPPNSNGDVMPVATIRGINTGLGLAHGITLDSDGNIYVLNGIGIGEIICVGSYERTATTDHANSIVATRGTYGPSADPILIFAAGSHGDVAPIGAIGGPFTGLYGPSGIAIGPAGP